MSQSESVQRMTDNAARFSAHRLLMAQEAQETQGAAKPKARPRRVQSGGYNLISATQLLLSGKPSKQKPEIRAQKDKQPVAASREEFNSPAEETAADRKDISQTVEPKVPAIQHDEAPAILEEAKKTGEDIEESPDVLDAKAREEFEKAAAETAREDQKYIVDKRTLICHFAWCDRASEIPEEYQLKVAYVPFQGRIALCTNCFRDKTREQQLKTYLKTCKPGSKNDIVSKAIVAYCEKLGIHAEVKAGVAYITTVAGEWYFTYNDRPIVLHHKNAEKRYDAQGHEKKSQYHIQEQKFYSPAHALAYIAIHDRPERALAIAAEQLGYMNRSNG